MAIRLVTRSDFDGLVCGALLLEAGVIDTCIRSFLPLYRFISLLGDEIIMSVHGFEAIIEQIPE